MDTNSRPTHRRARSLDLADTLDRIEMLRQQVRQPFLENSPKYIKHENPPSAPNPSSSVVRSNDETDSARTLSVPNSTKTSEDYTQEEQPRSVTPISELIQRFTAEILNSESSPSQSQVSSPVVFESGVKSSLTSPKGTEPPVTKTNQVSLFAAPFNPPNWARDSNQEEKTQDEEVTLRRPSEFLRNERTRTSFTSLSRPSSSDIQPKTEIGRTYKTTSLEMSITSPKIFQAISNSPKLPRRVDRLNSDQTDSKPTNFPSWVPVSQDKSSAYKNNVSHQSYIKSSSFQNTLPKEDQRKYPGNSQRIFSTKSTGIDETDSRTSDHPSWIPIPYESKNVKPSVSSKSSVFQPSRSRSSSFQSSLLKEDQQKHSGYSQRILSSKNTGFDETDSRTTEHPSWIPISRDSEDVKPSVSCKSTVSYTRSSFQKPVLNEDNRTYPGKAQSILSGRSLNADVTDSRTSNHPSWVPTSQGTASRSNVPRLFRSSSYQNTSITDRISGTSTVSADGTQNYEQDTEEAVEIRKHSVSSSSKCGEKYIEAVHAPKLTRRYSSNSLTSFPRRSLTPSVPVKDLVQKYSSK